MKYKDTFELVNLMIRTRFFAEQIISIIDQVENNRAWLYLINHIPLDYEPPQEKDDDLLDELF